MKTAKLSDIRKRNAQRRSQAMRAARRVNPNFAPGMRTFDRHRKNAHKQQILEEMQKREYELQRR
ncbi:hypothetical protein [Salinicoccus halodurans]|uniref:Uncharacterized protein n=1 Tax=Salinicoccus halodurans TaxID=407035 RepID=A0A0F7HK52_9STAP|nr:hypothetical protein [Salinicoccus halodurans]AKG73437.1 hypothetical protein AAT16_03930 [Salinicoccus halodurans]SFK50522.1 hypothetical protein SAMN05216235_0021 [Salinicoccus halodurans]